MRGVSPTCPAIWDGLRLSIRSSPDSNFALKAATEVWTQVAEVNLICFFGRVVNARCPPIRRSWVQFPLCVAPSAQVLAVSTRSI